MLRSYRRWAMWNVIVYVLYLIGSLLVVAPASFAIYVLLRTPDFECMSVTLGYLILWFDLPGVPGGHFVRIPLLMAYLGTLLITCGLVVTWLQSR